MPPPRCRNVLIRIFVHTKGEHPIKKALSLVLLLVLCLTLTSCKVSKEDLVGTWTGLWTYEGNSYVRTFVLEDDDTYSAILYKNGDLYEIESGVYEIDGKTVSLYETGEQGHTNYDYKGGKLVNNGHKFIKE